MGSGQLSMYVCMYYWPISDYMIREGRKFMGHSLKENKLFTSQGIHAEKTVPEISRTAKGHSLKTVLDKQSIPVAFPAKANQDW